MFFFFFFFFSLLYKFYLPFNLTYFCFVTYCCYFGLLGLWQLKRNFRVIFSRLQFYSKNTALIVLYIHMYLCLCFNFFFIYSTYVHLYSTEFIAIVSNGNRQNVWRGCLTWRDTRSVEECIQRNYTIIYGQAQLRYKKNLDHIHTYTTYMYALLYLFSIMDINI